MYEIFVGQGKRGNYAMTVSINTVWNISENGYSYWLYHSNMRVQIFVTKDAEEAKELDNLFRDGNTEIIDNFITSVMLKYIAVQAFLSILNDIAEKSYRMGSTAKVKEIKSCLG